MRTLLSAALAMCALSVSVVEGQTISEQLQRAIYTQSMLGDLDGAIRQYQQIIEKSPVNSDVRTQAERLLAAAEAYRGRAGASGEFVSSVYFHRRTEITFEVPRFMTIEGIHPSPDNGEQVQISMPSLDPSRPPTRGSVSMMRFPAAIDDAAVERQLADAPLMKARQHAQDGTGWTLRKGPDGQVSLRMAVGDKQGVSATADYRQNGRAMVEIMWWAVTNRNRAFFSLPLPAEELERPVDGSLNHFSVVVQSAKIP